MLSDKVMVDMDMPGTLGSNPGVGANKRCVVVFADMRRVTLGESPVLEVTPNR